MTEEIINKDELKNLRFLLQSGQKLAISTKEFERVFDKIDSLEQENKDFEILVKSLYKRIEELEKENEALAFRERLYKADYNASEQENKQMKEEKEKYKPFYELGAKCTQLNEVADSLNNLNSKYKSALEEIRNLVKGHKVVDEARLKSILDKIEEVLK